MPIDINDILSKISKPDLAKWKADFELAHTPVALVKLVQQFSDIVGDHAVDSPHAGFWRDAYIASKFGILRNACRIQMLRPEKDSEGKIAPDFQIEMDGAWVRYELVEALPSGRRRSDEFREDREASGGKARLDHVPSKVELTDILSLATKGKALKSGNYADCCGLVVMLSTWAMLNDNEKEEAFTDGTEEAGKAFGEVWVIKGDVVHLVWLNGHRAL